MTAVPVPSAPGRRAHEQQQLAAFLRERRDNPAITGDREQDYRPGAPCMDCGDYPGLRHEASDCPRALAAALLAPDGAVTKLAAARVASALAPVLALADEWADDEGFIPVGRGAKVARARDRSHAARLRAATDRQEQDRG